MIEREPPRTRLEQLLRQRHVTLEEFRKNYQRVAKTEFSERQAYRWVAGELSTLPYPAAQSALENVREEPVDHRLASGKLEGYHSGVPHALQDPLPVTHQGAKWSILRVAGVVPLPQPECGD